VSFNFQQTLFSLLSTHDDLARQVLVWLHTVWFRVIQFGAIHFGGCMRI